MAGGQIFPIACIDLVARGLDLGRILISPESRVTDLGQVTHVSAQGTWKEIKYGSGIESSELEVVRTSIGVPDPDGSLLRKLQTYNPRGSAARQWWACKGILSTQWEPLFTGILEDWERSGQVTVLVMKCDDSMLRKPIPEKTFSRMEWSAAEDATIFETAVPLCLGVFDAYAVTGRGMVPAVNVVYDETLGYIWWASQGHQKTITRVFVDGEVQASTAWSTTRGVKGGALATFIVFAAGYQPEKGTVVSFDCEGPDEDGLYAGDPIEIPSDVLRVVLEENVFRSAPTGAWRGAHPTIDATSWDYVEAWLAARGYRCARRFGGDQNPEAAAAAIQDYLDKHPWQRIQWTEDGTLSIFIIDPDDFEPSSSVIRIDLHHDGGSVDYSPGDSKEVYSHWRVWRLWSPAESKFLAGLWAHDIAALPMRVEKEIQNTWSAGAFS